MDRWYTLDELQEVASELLREHTPPRVFALQGELGAGKTTLVASCCRQLGVLEPVDSPTYAIINEYTGAIDVIYHLDCYRLNGVEEAIDAGIEELLQQNGYTVFVEWPAVIEPLLPPDVVFLRLDHDPAGAGRRRIRTTTGQPAANEQ